MRRTIFSLRAPLESGFAAAASIGRTRWDTNGLSSCGSIRNTEESARPRTDQPEQKSEKSSDGLPSELERETSEHVAESLVAFTAVDLRQLAEFFRG